MDMFDKVLTLLIIFGAVATSHTCSHGKITGLRKEISSYESRILVCEQNSSRTIDDIGQLDQELDLYDKRIEIAKKDRDVAFLVLGDMRISIEAIAATQKGRVRAPYIPKRKRP